MQRSAVRFPAWIEKEGKKLMRMMKVAVVGGALALGGCFDMEMDTMILGADEVRLSGFMQVNREMLDMMGGVDEFCPEEDGTLEETDTYVRCNFLAEGTVEEVFEGDEDAPTIEDLGDGTVRVTIMLDEFTGEMDEMVDDPAAMAMFRPMMEGHGMTFSISGAEIVSTNGELSDDGTSASVSFALTDTLEEDHDIPEMLEAVVRY